LQSVDEQEKEEREDEHDDGNGGCAFIVELLQLAHATET
jgi:hypothetical protein